MSRATDLRSDYTLLGRLLKEAGPKEAPAIVRERRAIAALLETLESPKVVTTVDQLAARRQARSGDSGSSTRRRKSG
jgi:hypothetical protein